MKRIVRFMGKKCSNYGMHDKINNEKHGKISKEKNDKIGKEKKRKMLLHNGQETMVQKKLTGQNMLNC